MLSLLHVTDDAFTAVSKGSSAVWNAMASTAMDLSVHYRFVALHQILSFHWGGAAAVHVFLWQANGCAIN